MTRPYLRALLRCIYRHGSMKTAGGLGCVLIQTWPEKGCRVVAYVSRSLKPHEHNYMAFLLEMAAIHFRFKHFHHYLYGGKQFIIFTDHKPLETLNKNHTKTLSRLQEDLMEYNYIIKYHPGKDNGLADFLSRNPIITIMHKSYYNLQSDEDVFWLLDEQANECVY